MIGSLSLTGKMESSPNEKYSWMGKCLLFAENGGLGTVDFKPGLNVLFGPNGSGKSTIAGVLAHLLAAEQGGVSTITSQWMSDLLPWGGKGILPNVSLVHDGQSVVYINSRNEVGLSCGGAAFDDDFMSDGIRAIFARRQSSGEQSLEKMGVLVSTLQKDALDASLWKMKEKNPVGERHSKTVKELLEPKMPRGQPTIILDEPENGFSLPLQAAFWRNMMSEAKLAGFQVIVASHSPFALMSKHAHFIEMVPGYADECRRELLLLSTGFDLDSLFPPAKQEAPTAKKKTPK